MMIKAKIEEILNKTFAPDFLEVIDDSQKHLGHAGAAQGGHFHVMMVSSAFLGKNRLESHRMVYKALEPLKPSIHALAINVKASTS